MPANSTDLKLQRWLLLTTFALGAMVFYWKLGDIALLSFNEARRAIPAAGMAAGGDWLLPQLNGQLYLTKPPLLYWLSALIADGRGVVDEWSVRLPSALAANMVMLGVYRFAARHFGAWPALFATQILVANAGFAMFARRAEIEMLLAALCSSALLAALHYSHGGGSRLWLRLSYFLLGLAVLTKGPLALLFVTVPLLADAIYSAGARQWAVLKDGWSWTILAVVGLSWYLAVSLHLGFGIWQATVERDMVNKIQGATGEPFYSYLLWLLADFFPASLLLLLVPLATWRRWQGRAERVALVLAVLLPLLIYSVFSDKHAKYLLPLYPALALLLGVRLGELFASASLWLRRCLLLLGLLLPAGYAIYYGVAEARIFDYRVSVFPQFRQWLATTGNTRCYAYKELDERLVYYAQRNIPVLDQAALRSLRAAHSPFFLLVESHRLAEIAPAADCRVRTFSPYLKKNKSLVLLGFAGACGVQGNPPQAGAAESTQRE